MAIKVVKKETLKVYGLNQNQMDKIKSDLTLVNPAYISAKRFSKWNNIKIPRYLTFYDVYKDYMEIYGPLYDFLHKSENENFIKLLQEVLGEVRKQERRINNRTYKPRVIKNLDFLNND